MNIWIASDIHGSALYCRKLLDLAERQGADRLVLLGDLLYHGPRNDLPEGYDTKAVFAMLNGWKDRILCVRGNCDAEVDQMVLQFPIMADYALVEAEGVRIYATHGHLWNEERLPPAGAWSILLHGHTHVPACAAHEGYAYLNPGSVSIPKENSRRGYMTLESGVFRWKDLSGETWREYAPGDR